MVGSSKEQGLVMIFKGEKVVLLVGFEPSIQSTSLALFYRRPPMNSDDDKRHKDRKKEQYTDKKT